MHYRPNIAFDNTRLHLKSVCQLESNSIVLVLLLARGGWVEEALLGQELLLKSVMTGHCQHPRRRRFPNMCPFALGRSCGGRPWPCVDDVGSMLGPSWGHLKASFQTCWSRCGRSSARHQTTSVRQHACTRPANAKCATQEDPKCTPTPPNVHHVCLFLA